MKTLTKANCGLIKKVKHKVTTRIRAMKIIKKELLEMKEEEAGLFKEIALLRSLVRAIIYTRTIQTFSNYMSSTGTTGATTYCVSKVNIKVGIVSMESFMT
jgi:hypothetical protein